MTNRRSFIKGAGLAGAGVLAAPAIVKAEAPIKWRFQTYAGPALGEHVTKPIIDAINKAANGALEIELYYADQMDAAFEKAGHFRARRIPKYLIHFDNAIAASGGPFVLGQQPTHVDTSLFQLMEGLDYMFPNYMRAMQGSWAYLEGLQGAVPDLEGVADYLASERRMEFNEDGIFRHYEELDEL